jgi:hypothetical protein
MEGGKLVVRPRAEPLTPERLQQLERDWRDRVRTR